MANSTTTNVDTIEGVDSAVYATLTLSGTYATGGETITPGQFGLSVIKALDVNVSAASTVAVTGFYLASTGKIVLRDATGAQAANGGSLTGITLDVRVIGA